MPKFSYFVTKRPNYFWFDRKNNISSRRSLHNHERAHQTHIIMNTFASYYIVFHTMFCWMHACQPANMNAPIVIYIFCALSRIQNRSDYLADSFHSEIGSRHRQPLYNYQPTSVSVSVSVCWSFLLYICIALRPFQQLEGCQSRAGYWNTGHSVHVQQQHINVYMYIW